MEPNYNAQDTAARTPTAAVSSDGSGVRLAERLGLTTSDAAIRSFAFQYSGLVCYQKVVHAASAWMAVGQFACKIGAAARVKSMPREAEQQRIWELGEIRMKVSVVTNAFNQERFLESAMRSVLAQDWHDMEYFVVEPGSKDRSRAIIEALTKEFPGRIILLTEPDTGPADGMNKAFEKATGDLFYYINGDDLLLPGSISSAVAAARKYPKAAAIYADGYLIDEFGRVIKRAISTRFSLRRFIYGGTFILQQSTFYRSQAFRAVGGFNAENIINWDIEIIFHMCRAGMPLRRVKGFWSAFRIHSTSITGSQRLVHEGQRHHLRYFQIITGRAHRNLIDQLLRAFISRAVRLLEPRKTIYRIIDAIRPEPRKF